jgi:hypothetical protein
MCDGSSTGNLDGLESPFLEPGKKFGALVGEGRREQKVLMPSLIIRVVRALRLREGHAEVNGDFQIAGVLP